MAHSDPGFPGYAMELTPFAPTLPELLRSVGYQTLMVGKWHLTKDSQVNDAGDRSSWPIQKGFDRYYGFLDAFTNFHHPHRLIEDNHAVAVDQYPDDYFVTDDFTDRAISMIRETKASDPTKPFFLYFAQAAVHAPLQAKADDIARHADAYHEGWDVIRQRRYDRQRELGVVPEHAELRPPQPRAGRRGGGLGRPRRRPQAAVRPVHGGVRRPGGQPGPEHRPTAAALEELGEWDNTLFIFTSDNGGSREGEVDGTTAYFRLAALQPTGARGAVRGGRERPDRPGRRAHHVAALPAGLGHGVQHAVPSVQDQRPSGRAPVPFVVSWPDGGLGGGGELRDQFVHVTDLLPTFLELAGVHRPDTWKGEPVLAAGRRQRAATLTDASAPGPDARRDDRERGSSWVPARRVGGGHPPRSPDPVRGRRLGVVRHGGGPDAAPRSVRREPQRLTEMIGAWEESAWDNQVFPLDEGTGYRFLLRPPWTSGFDGPVVLRPGTPTFDRWRSQRLILWRDVRITARVTLADGDAGILVAHGDQGGGYSLYVDDTGELVAAHNGYGMEGRCAGPVVAPGDHELELRITCPGQDRWNLALAVDGQEVAAATDFRLLMAMAPFEGIDIGMDRRSPVCWSVYQRHGPFPFTGTLHQVAYNPGAPAPDSPTNFLEFLQEWGRGFESARSGRRGSEPSVVGSIIGPYICGRSSGRVHSGGPNRSKGAVTWRPCRRGPGTSGGQRQEWCWPGSWAWAAWPSPRSTRWAWPGPRTVPPPRPHRRPHRRAGVRPPDGARSSRRSWTPWWRTGR